jgi:hypothetical protein
MIRTQTEEVWSEYQKSLAYCQSIGLFETVQKNEDFFTGDQWKGVNAPDMDKPVANILKRPVSYLVASIMSDDIGISFSRYSDAAADRALMEMLENQQKELMETATVKKKWRNVLRDACVDGDGCMHYYFDADVPLHLAAEGVEQTPGVIKAEVLENTCVYFGNTESADVEGQPWILIRYRRGLETLREWAKENGIDPESIQSDEEADATNAENEKDKVTVLRKYWMEKGELWYLEQTHDVQLRKPIATGQHRYPLVWLPWDRIKNRYHGQAVLTGMISNQIYRNKLIAMATRHVYMMAFPKVVYNNALINKWNNRVGEAIAANGDPNQAIASGFRAPDMSAQVMELIRFLKDDTTEAVGASDAALGNVKPDNTSAIIATQKATAVPLELQRMAFYDMVEESVRIWVDMMAARYGVRLVRMKEQLPDGQTITVEKPFDFRDLQGMDLRLEVEVGAASYWSELTETATLSNLFSAGAFGPKTYMKNLPRGALANRNSILEDMEAEERAAMMAGGKANAVPTL